jgi:hypothetical protein
LLMSYLVCLLGHCMQSWSSNQATKNCLRLKIIQGSIR